MTRRFALLLGLLLAAPVCLGQDQAELEVDHNLQAALVTPHTDWAVPYAHGKTRVLFFVRGHDTEPREVVELQQRLDLDAEMVLWTRIIDYTQEHWHGDERGIQRMARLLTEKWDAFVFLSPEGSGVRDVTPELLPVEQQLALLKAVTDGAGLVLVGADDQRVLKDKNRLRELPTFLSDVQGAAAFSILRGRGVRLPKRAAIPYRRGWEADYDRWAMRVGKAILWAAGKEPKLGLTLQPAARDLSRAVLPAAAATMQWQNATLGTVVDVRLRRDDGEVIQTDTQLLDSQQGERELSIPRVRAGQYHLDVVARAGDLVAAFGSVGCTVVSDRAVRRVTLDEDWAEVGGQLTGRVQLAGEGQADDGLTISLLDRQGRQIARHTASANAAEQPFRFDVQPWFPMLLEVRATLTDAAGEVASAEQSAHVVKRHRGRFNFVMWDTPRGALAPWAEQALADSGVTVHLAGGTPQPWLAAYAMAWIPYTTHISGPCQPVCWADESQVQSHVEGIVAKCAAARQHGVFAYSLGDEIAVRGSCLSPHCLAAYRRYLQHQYGDIAALNASWASRYASFDEIQLGQPGDNDEAEALRSGNLPRWFDRQAYQSHNFCQLCERFGKAFRTLDPDSRCGFEGAGTFGHADDLDGFVRCNTFWSPYPGTADEVVRSIAPRAFPRSNWMGYTKDVDSLLEKYWRMITRGCDSVWWWRWDALGRFHGWLAPNLDPYPAVQQILADTQIVRDGLGDLLLDSTLQTDGIGLLYSLPSAYAAKVQTSPSYGSYESNHAAFHSTFRELGLNFRYFTDRQLRLGEVDLSQFRVIVLPLTQALSAREADLLRAYVRGGGVLIADVRPAIYDGHVKPLVAGQLDDVFGIRRSDSAAARVSDGVIQASTATDAAEPLSLTKIRTDGGVQATEATVGGMAGQTPLLLEHQFGEGRALLLNAAMSSLPALGADETPEAAARWLLRALSLGRVAPPLSLTGSDGQRLRNAELTRWQNGSVQIVSVFRHQGRSETATLRLPEPLHVYDLKARRHLGRQAAVSLAVTPSRAMFYALSPQPLPAVALTAAPSVAPGSLQRVAVVSHLAEGRQAVKIQVTLPDGRPADWVQDIVVTGRDGAAVDVPIACNDPRGVWTIQATELYTGTTASTQFKVE